MNRYAVIDLGFAKIWDFESKKDEFVKNLELKEKIGKILQSYKTTTYKGIGSPLSGIGIVSVGDIDFREPSIDEKEKIKHARLILFLAFISLNNTIEMGENVGHKMASSENFETFNYSLVIEGGRLTEQTGFVITSNNMGIDLENYVQPRPTYVLSPIPFSVDKDLFQQLIILRQKRRRLFQKIMSAAEVFFESYYNAPHVSHNARILLQASAFEILLDSTISIRKAFKEFIRAHINHSEDRIYTYYYEKDRAQRKTKERGTMKEIWADRFFTLRNHIIHGSQPKQDEFVFNFRSKSGFRRQRHFDIATLFFVHCIKKIMNSSLGEVFDDEINWRQWTDDLTIPPQHYEGFTYNHFSGRKLFERLTKQ